MKVKLGEIFQIASGGTPSKQKTSYYKNGTIPWVKTGDLKEKYVIENVECITEDGLANSSAKLFPANTVLVAMYGATIGASSILSYEAATNQACAAFLPNKEVLPEYLYYFLCSKKEQFIKDSVGGAQPNISAGYLKTVQIELETIEEQSAIVSSLDKVDNLIDLRKKQLEQLDLLVKSRFIEIFGDLADPDCQYNKCKLIEVCANNDGIKCGPFGTQLNKNEYQESGVSVWEIPQINSGFKEQPTHFITDEKAKELSAYSLLPGDIAMSRKGNVGRCGLFPPSYAPGIIHSDVLRIRVDKNRVSPCFMMCQLHFSRDVQRQIEMVSSGAIMAGVNVTKLKQIDVYVPDFTLQEQFSDFVAQVDKSKLVMHKILQKLQELYEGHIIFAESPPLDGDFCRLSKS